MRYNGCIANDSSDYDLLTPYNAAIDLRQSRIRWRHHGWRYHANIGAPLTLKKEAIKLNNSGDVLGILQEKI